MSDTRYKVKKLNGYNGGMPDVNKPAAKFLTFEDLEAYQAAREFRKAIYEAARQLPDLEKYGLGPQMRRAAVSLTNNIAEGHGRYHYADQIKFILQARGSLEELMDDLNVCIDEKYLSAAAIDRLKQTGLRTLQIINGYGRFLRQKKAAQLVKVREVAPEESGESEEDPFAYDPL